jgi:hypothetical protein
MTEPTGEEKSTTTLKFSDLRRLISDTVDSAFKSREDSQPEPRDPGQPRTRQLRQEPKQQRSIDDEVSAALKKIEKDKERERREQQIDTDITDLKEKTKEKPPVERRKIHGRMGWGE